MNKNPGNTETIVNEWIESSDKDFSSMQKLFKSNDLSMALFVGHQVIEKLLNAYYVRKHLIHAVHIHDLLRLAREIEHDLPQAVSEDLKGISIFNLNVHCDNYKQEFIKLCTPDFTAFWIMKIENLRTWILSKI